MASALFQIDPGTGIYASAGQAVDVSASGATINCRVVDTSGIIKYEWEVFGTSSDAVAAPNPTLSGSPPGQIASFILPAGAGKAYGIQLKVTDSTGLQSINRSAAFILSAGGFRPFIAGEVFEENPTHGPVDRLNEFVVSGGGGGDVASVFGRTGAVVAVTDDYAASEVENDSGVAGAQVSDALDTLEAADTSILATIAALDSDDIDIAAGISIPEVGSTLTEAIQWLGEGHRYFSPTYLNPLAQWNPGVSLSDQTANGLNLTVDAGTLRISGAQSIQSAYFDGSLRLIGPAAGSTLERAHTLTFVLLVKIHSVQTVNRTLLTYALTGETEATNVLYSMDFSHQTYNINYFTENGPGNNISASRANELFPPVQTIAMVGARASAPSGGQIAVDFIQGGRVVPASALITTPTGGTTSRLYIGQNQDGASGFIGEIFSVAIYGAALTDQEIANIYNSVLGGVDGPEPYIFS